MQRIKEKAVAAVPLAPPLKNGLPFAPTCIPNKEVFSDFVTNNYGPGCSNLDNPGFLFLLFKAFSRINFSVIFESIQSLTLLAERIKLNFFLSFQI